MLTKIESNTLNTGKVSTKRQGGKNYSSINVRFNTVLLGT